ncbi:TPA: phosphatidylinositol-specific phospholipase C [Listeria monocytogenes]|nr:phosphatidylinositol-specific phospholipase C [Listeria monocytogenes]
MYKNYLQRTLVLVLCFILCFFTFPLGGKAYSLNNWNKPIKNSVTTKQWMSALPDTTSLAALSIPGTHDTMSYNGDMTWTLTKPLAQTQTMSLYQQLEAGIRYIDIRAKDNLKIYHGPIFLNASLSGVLETITQFLKKNPKETIIMRLKDEQNSNDSFDYRIQPLINIYKDYFYTTPRTDTSNKIPTLKDVRGKILLLSENHTKKPLVINSNKFGMQFGASNQVIQDDYNGPSVKTKFKEIVQTAYQAFKADNKLFLNHISATSLTFTPRQYAAALNNKVEQFVLNLTSEKVRGLGILIMDFPEKQTIKNIIKNNKFN